VVLGFSSKFEISSTEKQKYFVKDSPLINFIAFEQNFTKKNIGPNYSRQRTWRIALFSIKWGFSLEIVMACTLFKVTTPKMEHFLKSTPIFEGELNRKVWRIPQMVCITKTYKCKMELRVILQSGQLYLSIYSSVEVATLQVVDFWYTSSYFNFFSMTCFDTTSVISWRVSNGFWHFMSKHLSGPLWNTSMHSVYSSIVASTSCLWGPSWKLFMENALATIAIHTLKWYFRHKFWCQNEGI